MPTPQQLDALRELQRRKATLPPDKAAAVDELSSRWLKDELPQVPEAPSGLINKIGAWGAKVAQQRQAENERLAASGHPKNPLSVAIEAFAPNAISSAAKIFTRDIATPTNAALSIAALHPVGRAALSAYGVAQGGVEGAEAPYTTLYRGTKEALLGTNEGLSPEDIEGNAMKGAMFYGGAAGLGESVPKTVKAGQATINNAKIAAQIADRLGKQRVLYPQLAGVPDASVAGAEAVFRAAAPVSMNPGFRDNLYAALGDLSEIANKNDLRKTKGGIRRPDLRINQAVKAIKAHLKGMYQTERFPQVQRNATQPTAITLGADAMDGLDYMRNFASTNSVRNAADAAYASGVLEVRPLDELQRAVSAKLYDYEHAPPEIQAQMRQASPKIANLKALDIEITDILNNQLRSFGEVGIKDYERRYAGLSDVRKTLTKRINQSELERKGVVERTPILKMLTKKPSLAGASMAATADLTSMGHELQTGFDLLRRGAMTAQRGSPALPPIPPGPGTPPPTTPGTPPAGPGASSPPSTPPTGPNAPPASPQAGAGPSGRSPRTPRGAPAASPLDQFIQQAEAALPPEAVAQARANAQAIGADAQGYADILDIAVRRQRLGAPTPPVPLLEVPEPPPSRPSVTPRQMGDTLPNELLPQDFEPLVNGADNLLADVQERLGNTLTQRASTTRQINETRQRLERVQQQRRQVEGIGPEGTERRIGGTERRSTANPEPAPRRTLWIGRGAHGQVQVEFPSSNAADLYSYVGRARRAMRGEGSQAQVARQNLSLAQRFGISPRDVFDLSTRYRTQVHQAIAGLEEGSRHVAGPPQVGLPEVPVAPTGSPAPAESPEPAPTPENSTPAPRRRLDATVAPDTSTTPPLPRVPELRVGIENIPVGEVGAARMTDLSLDPERFQFKGDVNEKGVSNKLASVKQYDPSKAGVISVWTDPADGKTYVVNGHHRFDLAQRAGIDRIDVRRIRANTAQEARAAGALQNIAEGNGTLLDVAKFMRDTGATPQRMQEEGISPSSKLAREGAALARLDQSLFDRVALGAIDEQRAIAIGEGTGDPTKQWGIVELINDAERRGRNVPIETVREMARLANSAGTIETTQEGLFGPETQVGSLALVKAEVSSHIKTELAKDLNLYRYASSAERAAKLGEHGNLLNVKENQRIKGIAAQNVELYDRLSEYQGPLDDVLNHAARRIAQGDDPNVVKREALSAVRQELDRARSGTGGAGPPEGGQGSQGSLSGLLGP